MDFKCLALEKKSVEGQTSSQGLIRNPDSLIRKLDGVNSPIFIVSYGSGDLLQVS